MIEQLGTLGKGLRLTARHPWYRRLWQRFFPPKPTTMKVVSIDREKSEITVGGHEDSCG